MLMRPVPLDDIYRSYSLPKLGQTLSSQEAMDLAWKLAWQGAGYVKSNPLVGAVCVDKEQGFVAAAWHEGFGKAHAEQALINKIQNEDLLSSLKKATIYVTLEPCGHIGKTPPCAQLLSDLPLEKIVYGLHDPTKKTSGKGIALLQSSGIKTELFQGTDEFMGKLRQLLEHFYSYEIKKRVFVAAKVACTLNGVFAYTGAERAWITGQRARSYGHWLRLRYDAVMVGADTAIQDNPLLTIRSPLQGRTPLRVVVDPEARALGFRAFAKNNLLNYEIEKTLWCLTKKSWKAFPAEMRNYFVSQGLKTLILEENSREKIFAEILAFLFTQGLASLMIEGGAGVWASAFNGNGVDKLYLFQAPKLLCSKENMLWTQGFNCDVLDLKQVVLTRLQEDLLIEGYTREQSNAL